ncbi:HNH endonuclease signature motif containing protein [Candidatus Poriferisodalis sp.]|uniref:HNH endonuclease signature motif containing protein n=1 Tax=Candidatus Poriferisodalis sp. TaxID=3101277 RepID=UPI003B02CDEF
MKRADVRSDSAAGMPTGSVPAGPVPAGDAVAAMLPALSSPVEPASLRVKPAEPTSLRVEPVPPAEPMPPVEPVSPVEGVLSVLCGARDVVARVSRVPLGGGCDALADVIEVASRLRSATDAVVLSATAALEAARPGSGRCALVGRARMSKRNAKRTVESSEQVAQMPNTARGLAAGELNAEHAAVLADAARRTSPDAVDTAAELLQAAAVVSPETLRDQAKKFTARHDPDAAETELGRQRRARCASLFVDESTGMGVLHAELDPVSYALMRQALENYNDALWRLDGGRDATPGQIRDNRQRLADSLFEMVTDRNALATIDHPAAHTPNHTHRPQSDDGHCETDRNPNTDHDHGHGHDRHSDADRGSNSDHSRGHDRHSDADRGSNSDADRGSGSGSGSDADGDGGSEGSAGRSVDRWRPAQAPNQLVIIAEIGVIDGTKPDGTCEMLGAGPVPPSILDNLSPDTRIAGALFDTNGEILWLGRNRRHASIAQQLAVAVRDRGCVLCRLPMHRCDYHHINEWAADNGTTDTPNLAALCGDCHDKLHKNNQRLQRRPAPRKWDTTPRTHTTSQTNDTTATGPP